ncbi:MAG: ATP-binding protein [Armatimonadota bacterium]
MTPPAAREERKLVTVLFADLAGSTELSVRYDPEPLRGLLSAFFEEMAHEVRVFGGTVEKYAGDAIMAVFGVPRVHEDDAERAVRAALAMRESLDQLNPTFEEDYQTRLQMRIGVATGEAVAATEPTREFAVTGDVANLAARLQTAAQGIVISEETHRLLAPLVEAQPMPPLLLKGFPKPVTAYSVTGLREIDSRPRGIPGLSSPVVGRDHELETLHRCPEELGRGRGQIISVVGEAGLGKSRLKIELRENLPKGLLWLEGRCYAHTQPSSYGPFVQILNSVLRLRGAEPQAVARIKLRAALQSLLGARSQDLSPVVAQLLGIELEPEGQASLPTDPQAFHTQIVVTVRAVLEGLAGRTPVIVAFEDIHWADAASIELVTVLMELTDFLPLMILVTCRPDTEGKAWDLRFHAQRNFPHRLTEIQLAPLAQDDSESLVSNLLHVSDLPGRLRKLILDRSEGNPFFVEEIIRSLIEQQVLRHEGNRWIAAVDAARFAIPSTLRGLIAARIDRLPAAAKVVVQHASVVGRTFTYRILRSLLNGDNILDPSLASLLRAELILERARLPEPEYVFKHALTQESAYASILKNQRKDLHRKVAAFLEKEWPESPDEHAALLAHHWLQAEEWEQALAHTLRAAGRAARLYARPEAIAHYWQALELFERLPVTDQRQQEYIAAVLALANLPGSIRAEADREEEIRHIDTALRAAAERKDAPSQARLEAATAMNLSDQALGMQAIARAEASGDAGALAFTLFAHGVQLGAVGQYEEALRYVRRTIEVDEAAGDLYGQAFAMASLARCYCARAGRLDDALDYAARGHAIGQTLADARLRAWRAMVAEPYMYKGLWEQVVQAAEEGLPVAWEIGEWNVFVWISSWLGIAHLKLGRPEEARRVLGRARSEAQARRMYSWPMTYLHIGLAQLHLALSEPAESLELARKALTFAEQSGYRLEQGAANRILGQVYEALNDPREAETAYRRSVQILDEIQSPPELGQTLLAYGRFKLRSDPAEGQRLVRRALSLFEETRAPGWADEAQAALAGSPPGA